MFRFNPPFIQKKNAVFSLSVLIDGQIPWSDLILCDDDVIAPEHQVNQIAESGQTGCGVKSDNFFMSSGFDCYHRSILGMHCHRSILGMHCHRSILGLLESRGNPCNPSPLQNMCRRCVLWPNADHTGVT